MKVTRPLRIYHRLSLMAILKALLLLGLLSLGACKTAEKELHSALRGDVRDSWEVRERLLGDWLCISNTISANAPEYKDVSRLRVYRPYCYLADTGMRDGPLAIAGALTAQVGAEQVILEPSNYLHVYLPDKLFIGPLNGALIFRLQFYKNRERKECLRLTRTRYPGDVLVFELLSKTCPRPRDLGPIFRTHQKVDISEMDSLYEEFKQECVKDKQRIEPR
jgi:hypothetical protein